MERKKERDNGGQLTHKETLDKEKVRVIVKKWLKPRNINRIIGDKK